MGKFINLAPVSGKYVRASVDGRNWEGRRNEVFNAKGAKDAKGGEEG
jgi:hypothetical protein